MKTAFAEAGLLQQRLPRQRFTIGHELGHLTLHHGHDLILERLVRLNFRDATSSTASDEESRPTTSPLNC